MASVDWQKTTAGAVAAMSAHYDKERREKVTHSNKDINVAETYQNVNIGGSFREIVTRLKKRVEELDKKHPPLRIRADRKTALALEVKVPQIITALGQAEEFCRAAYAEIEKNLGKENVAGAFIHFDEVHPYLDSHDGTIKTSLVHMHVVAVPSTPDGRVNAKDCVTRARMRNLNEAIDNLCLQKYNTHYLTGNGKECGLSVEELKARTAKAVKALDIDREIAEKEKVLQKKQIEYECLIKKAELPHGRKTIGDKIVYNASEHAKIEQLLQAASGIISTRNDILEREKRAINKERYLEEHTQQLNQYLYIEKPLMKSDISTLKTENADLRKKVSSVKELADKTYGALEKALKQLPYKTRREIAETLSRTATSKGACWDDSAIKQLYENENPERQYRHKDEEWER